MAEEQKQTPPVSPPSTQPVAKKGMSKGAKVGIGIGGGCCVIIILVIILAALGASKATKDTSKTTETKKQEETKKEEIFKIGDEVQVKDFKYKVNSTEKATVLGDQYYQKSPQGIFLLANITATNTGKETRTLSNSDFKIVDNQNREFSSSSDGQSAYDVGQAGGEGFFIQQVQPSLSKTGVMVFDVPVDAKGLKLIVGIGFGEGGKQIDLGI